jgi:hypothetical protein
MPFIFLVSPPTFFGCCCRFVVLVVVYDFTAITTKISFNRSPNISAPRNIARFWSIFSIIDLDRVIPNFTVISIVATIVLLVILVKCIMLEKKALMLAHLHSRAVQKVLLLHLAQDFIIQQRMVLALLVDLPSLLFGKTRNA